MSYWSNIQASRINWGANWKNLWIPNYNWLYTKYFISDQVLGWYLKLKFFYEDKLNRSHTYYYDYYINRIFSQTFLFLEKYNVNFTWLTQVGYLGKINTLFDGLSGLINIPFFNMAADSSKFMNFYFQPQNYYYYFVARHSNSNYNNFEVQTLLNKNLTYDQTSLLQGVSNSLFLTGYVFSTKTNFFDQDNFSEFENFFNTFEEHNISTMDKTYVKPKYIYKDKFWLANFLLNPTILVKYPNFIFYYNNWLHKSWQLAKKKILQSLKLFQVSYNHKTPVMLGVDYFFAKYVRFFFFMKELNLFFWGVGVGVGITHEFLAKQVDALLLKIRIWELMFSKIKEIWFYLKAYLKYFSYEGKINLNWSKIIFKKMFSFRILLKLTASGTQLTTPSLLSFLNQFFYSVLNHNILISLTNIFFFEKNFLKIWYIYLSKLFFKSLNLLKMVIWVRKITIFEKIKLLNGLLNDFFQKIFKWYRINLNLYPKYQTLNKWTLFSKIPLTFNGLIILILNFFKFDISRNEKLKIYLLNFWTFGIFPSKLFYQLVSWKRELFFIYHEKFHDIWKTIKHSDWFSTVIFHYSVIKNFLLFSFQWKIIWKKKFIYFYYVLANLTPKFFFWIFNDLSTLSHFSILIHLISIYWQNFFFFYLFILKCLKRMYAQCSRENLLFLSWPIKMILQRSITDTTLLDLFSSSFWEFLPLGLHYLKKNLEIGNQRFWFSLSDFATILVNFGKPNCWNFSRNNLYLYKGKFSYLEQNSISVFYIPFLSINFSAKTFFNKNSNISFDKKNRLNITSPFFTTRTPTHLIIKHYSNLQISATLIAVFIKKKLERDHLLAEVLWSLNLLVNQAETIKGFMFLLKGRFSWKERAAKIWFKRGKLEQTILWSKIDYCKMPIILKYGSASVRIWLNLSNNINELRAAI